MYILQNQNGYFLAKSGDWADGREAKLLFRTQHKDEAANELFEANSRDYSLRLTIVVCDANPKGLPIIEADCLPPPLSEVGADELSSDLFEQHHHVAAH